MKKSRIASRFKNHIIIPSVISAVALTAIATSPGVFAEDGLALEEVMVTARKREESLQDIAVSVTSVTEELKAASLRDVKDLQDYTPNIYLERNQGTPGGLNASIRGIQYSETDKSFDPSIGVVVDGMYLGTAAASFLDNFDTKRVEILRGPQGTLFGKNTTGGVINIIRGDVTGEFGGTFGITLGSDNRREFKGVLNLPLSETAGVKLFANSIDSDGFIRNTTLNRDVFGDDRQTYGAAVRWEPTEAFNIQLHYERNNDELTCFALGGCEATDTGSDEDNVSTDGTNVTDSVADNFILTANWDLGPVLLTSITTNRDLDQDYLIQFDGSPAELLRFNYLNEWEQTSQELRVTSQFSDTFEFVAGIYYWDVDYEQRWRVFDLFEVVAPFPADTYGFNGQNQETESTAVFFSGDWNISDTLTLTAGGRYTEEDKDFQGGSSLFRTPGPGQVAGPDTDPTQAEFEAVLTDFAGSWSEFSPKVALSWKPNDDLLTYISYTEGFKSGGFFGRQADFSGPDPTYEPEFVKTIELGVKSTLMNGRMTLNATAFSSDFEDKQEAVLIPISLTNVATVVRNASNLDILGLELEAQFQATEHWKLRASYGLLDAEYNGYNADITGDGVVTNNDNLTPQNTPDHTFSVNSAYTIPLGAGELGSYVSFRWRDDLEGQVANLPRGRRDDIINLNANVTYTWGDDGQYRLAAFGKNITDERENTFGIIAPLLAYRVWNEGARYGLQFDYNF